MVGVGGCLLLLVGIGQTMGRDIAKEFPARSCLDLCEVITSKNRSAGYKCECHNITTSDGFVLQTARIPPRVGNGTKLPVFLMHGFITSAVDWVSQPETGDSLPYMLSDAGYDVWLGNNRGNVFSVTNEKLDINSPDFWDKVDQDQMATIDVPTIIYYVLSQTGKPKLHWVGHSQGGGVLVFALAEDPSLSEVLATSALLAPGVHMANLHVPLLKTMVATHLDQTWRAVGIDIPGVATHEHYFPGPDIEKILEYFTGHTGLCSAKNFSVALCNDLGKILGISVGDPNNLDPKTMATAYNMDPGGSSFHLVMHWAQRIRKDTLQKYDWGLAGNLKNYGRPTAPTYDLKKIKGVRLGMWTGLEDLYVTPKDIASFVEGMNADTFVLQKVLPTYAHFDFPWGKNAKTLLYPDVIDLLKQETVFETSETSAVVV